jgi:hypothetical protein
MVSRAVSEHAGAGAKIESNYIGILDDKTEGQRALNGCRRQSRDQTQNDRRRRGGIVDQANRLHVAQEGIDTRLQRAS